MTLSISTLSTQLQNLIPADNEPDAVENLALAWSEYCKGAQALTPITAAGIALGEAAFRVAAIGISVPGQGAIKMHAAIIAFWGAVSLGLAVSFAGAIAVTPAFVSLTPSMLDAVFASTTAAGLSLPDAANAIATAIHATFPGGTVTTAGPVVTPII